MIKERLVDFIKCVIFNKYLNHLIILDNTESHKNNFVKNTIIESNNNYLFSVPYTSKTNVIENMFNQLKYYLKLNKKILKFKKI